MAPARRNKNSSGMNPFLAGLLILVAVVGVLFTLEATETTNLGLSKLWGGRKVHAGGTVVVMSMMSMEPGERLVGAKLWNPELGTFNHSFMDPALVESRGYIAAPQEVVGRVLARPKAANQVYVEADFLPKGSPEGVLGLIPAGLEVVPIDPKKIKGIELLGFRDRFDLRVMVEADDTMKQAAEAILKNRSYSSEAERMQLSAITHGPTKRTLVQNGMVIRQPKMKNGVVVVALHPDDVDGTIDALTSGLTIYMTARTGGPGTEVARVADEVIDPMADYQWILDGHRGVELLHGNDLERSVIPVSKN